MKKKVEHEITVCDVCGEECYESCLGCGINHCYDHQKELGIKYKYLVIHGGYMDGYYCLNCDTKLRASGDDPLHTAYITMKMLNDEYSAFHNRAAKVEKRIEALWEARKKQKQDDD